jgi:hypothetical protein
MQTVANALAALQDAAAAVKMAYDYEDEDTAINDAVFAIVEMLRTLHNNDIDVVDLAQQAIE